MDITIVQGAFKPVPPVTGGSVEKLWFDLGREFVRRGLGVTHISRRFPGLPPHDRIDGVEHRRITGYDHPRSPWLAKAMDFAYSLRSLWMVKRVAKPTDIVITNCFFLPLLLCWFARRNVVYVSVHRYPQGQMKLYGKVDRLQCVSTAVANAVREQAPAVGRLVKVVPNYVPSLLSEREVAAGWPARRQEVLFVGRLHPEKGIDLLLRAFAAIEPAAREGWTLRVVGPHDRAAGGYGEAFLAKQKQMATELGLQVEWHGPVYDRDALNDIYRHARIFVYPSIAAHGEAFPIAPLEAMAQGCPVVTSDLVCFDDFIRPGANAAVFRLADGAGGLGAVIAQLMREPERLRGYSAKGLRTVREFTLSRIADAFVDDFASLHKA